jgi:hypothetical protein
MAPETDRPRPFPFLALVLWIGVGLVLTVKSLLNPNTHSVFPIYQWASLGWWQDLPIYRVNGVMDVFRYPPVFAIALTPLAALGVTVGCILWSWLSLTIYGWGCLRFLRDVLPERWTAGRETLFLGLCLFGAMPGLWNAQANALIAGMTLLGAADLIRERPWRASLWLGGSILVKLTPIAIVALVCLARSRMLLPRLALVVILGALIPFATRPVEMVLHQHDSWLDQMRLNTQTRWPGYRDGWTLYQAGRWVVTGQPINHVERNDVLGYHLARLIGAGIAFAWVLMLRWRGANRRDVVLAGLALGGCWSLLFGASVEHCTMVVVIPSLIGSLLTVAQPGRFAVWLLRLAIVSMLFLTWHATQNGLRPLFPIIDVAMPFGVLLYVVWLALWSWHIQPRQGVVLTVPERTPRAA